ncbi:MAG: hypothetical protein AB1633_11055, partial [Elusimicrobiota bacterium]
MDNISAIFCKKCILFIFFLISFAFSKESKPLIFEKQIIEGKLKKPQVVLISTQQRPRFEPMAIELLKEGTKEIFVEVNPEIFESYKYNNPFVIQYNKF